MAKRNRILELEKEYGDLHAVIPPMVNQFDQKYAANQLGAAQSTISRWLNNNGYGRKTIWFKETVSTPSITNPPVREFNFDDLVREGFAHYNEQGQPELTPDGALHVFGELTS